MAKQVTAEIKVQVTGGQATPAPPVGTALGPYGVAIMDFCKDYNARTESQRGNVVPVDAAGLFDIKENDMIVVRGNAEIGEHGWLVITANGLYVRR